MVYSTSPVSSMLIEGSTIETASAYYGNGGMVAFEGSVESTLTIIDSSMSAMITINYGGVAYLLGDSSNVTIVNS